MKTFHLTVACIGENLFQGEAVSASLPGSEGIFEVLAGHEAFVSLLKQGKLRVRAADEQLYYFEVVKSGIAEGAPASMRSSSCSYPFSKPMRAEFDRLPSSAKSSADRANA